MREDDTSSHMILVLGRRAREADWPIYADERLLC